MESQPNNSQQVNNEQPTNQPPNNTIPPQQQPINTPLPQSNTAKNRKIIIIISIASATALVLFIVLGFIFYRVYSMYISPTVNNSSSVSTTEQNTATNNDSPTTTDSKNYAFTFPLNSVYGWAVDVYGKDGIYRYKQTTGTCQVMLRQANGAVSAKAKGLSPDYTVDTYLDATKKLVTNFVISSATPYSISNAGDGSTVSFPAKLATYDGNDGLYYTIKVGAQWMNDQEFLIVSSCQQYQWSSGQSDIDNFLTNIGIFYSN